MVAKAELSVSNIAWPADQSERAYTLLEDVEVSRIDVAPTLAFPQIAIEGVSSVGEKEITEFRNILANYGLRVAGMQSLTYGRTENIFKSNKNSFPELREHFARIFDLGQALGARTLVWGSPKMRTTGELTAARIEERAEEFITQIDQIANDTGLLLGIEPVSLSYTEGEPVFGETGEDVVNFIASMNQKYGTRSTRFVPDTFAMHDGNDLPIPTLKRAADLGILAPHLQIAEAGLAEHGAHYSPIHHDSFDAAFAAQLPVLHKEGETPIVAIEMTRKEDSVSTIEESLERAVMRARGEYRRSL